MDVLLETALPLPLHSRGKVRDTYELGGGLLMVATDRISAFDVVFREGIPEKGAVLTQLSAFWFSAMAHVIKNHVVSTQAADFGAAVQPFGGMLRNRSMLVRKTQPLKVECIVRGFLAGGGWKTYQKNGTVCGVPLPAGLKECEELPEPIFTPTTKAESGHDVDVTREQFARMVGMDDAAFLEESSLRIYEEAARLAERTGIIIADTKMEFGRLGDGIILIDELLTPDSSRFWPADSYEPGKPQSSFDKQFLREYLESTGWDKAPPPPTLPRAIVDGTGARYVEAFERITGEKLKTG